MDQKFLRGPIITLVQIEAGIRFGANFAKSRC